MKILILCTGNSCRSQMAEGFLKFFNDKISVFSAGTHPADRVNPFAVEVMKEVGIDIGKNVPRSVDLFLKDEFDYVITVCDNARETCPVFSGKVKNRVHLGFEDPAEFKGSRLETLLVYRRVRDQIREAFQDFNLSLSK